MTRGLLTRGSSSHVSIGYPASSILVIGAIFWPEIGHPLLVGGSVNCWSGRVGHLGYDKFWAIKSPRWKPGGSGHDRLWYQKEEGKGFYNVILFCCNLKANQCHTLLTFLSQLIATTAYTFNLQFTWAQQWLLWVVCVIGDQWDAKRCFGLCFPWKHGHRLDNNGVLMKEESSLSERLGDFLQPRRLLYSVWLCSLRLKLVKTAWQRKHTNLYTEAQTGANLWLPLACNLPQWLLSLGVYTLVSLMSEWSREKKNKTGNVV